jgi:hypothetical protein
MRRSREAVRRERFPNSDREHWRSQKEAGYFCCPRLLPLLIQLADSKELVGSLACGYVYLDLFSRVFPEGTVGLSSPREHAFVCGYQGQRAERSWNERILALEKNGFIRVKRSSFQEVTDVLIRHPSHVLNELSAAGKIPPRLRELLLEYSARYKVSKPPSPAVTKPISAKAVAKFSVRAATRTKVKA